MLTKDINIGRNLLEVQAIAQANGRVFILVSGNLSRQAMASIFVKAIDRIEKITQNNQAPFIAKIYQNSTVKLWKTKTELKKTLLNRLTGQK